MSTIYFISIHNIEMIGVCAFTINWGLSIFHQRIYSFAFGFLCFSSFAASSKYCLEKVFSRNCKRNNLAYPSSIESFFFLKDNFNFSTSHYWGFISFFNFKTSVLLASWRSVGLKLNCEQKQSWATGSSIAFLRTKMLKPKQYI
jgi:hypothetical protein